jgi:hypothetical protein
MVNENAAGAAMDKHGHTGSFECYVLILSFGDFIGGGVADQHIFGLIGGSIGTTWNIWLMCYLL